ARTIPATPETNMIIDFDSHLREGYFMDEVYKLEGPYERFRPVKLNDGRTHNTKFLHSLDPISPQGHAAHRHPSTYDPTTNGAGGVSRGDGRRVAALREGARLQDLAPRALLRHAQSGRPELLPLLPDGRRVRRAALVPSEQPRRAGRPVRQFLQDARARAPDQLQRGAGGAGAGRRIREIPERSEERRVGKESRGRG